MGIDQMALLGLGGDAFYRNAEQWNANAWYWFGKSKQNKLNRQIATDLNDMTTNNRKAKLSAANQRMKAANLTRWERNCVQSQSTEEGGEFDQVIVEKPSITSCGKKTDKGNPFVRSCGSLWWGPTRTQTIVLDCRNRNRCPQTLLQICQSNTATALMDSILL